ncbi:hypothetical protein D6C86_08275 [Aureobasidium pullulans]|uniref:Ubiquitin 3 binding protein But2 C-terminal domain-containing protein n=1 Tax=Aureobasidium pullulans TaxID=5580 RepID=A0A4S9UVH7_AURPU|nr:hypothetical protein D6C94_08852 [Aureobasidium pullulans]THZ43012.1 hypothetical protein D6C87_04611 [Aureobasidium pullulans]THZ55888.1 hypothetical protein D6C86_08275 [Aureobasidium pullulans]
MKYTLQSLALASVASARVLHTRQSSCCFGINVSGDGVEGGSLGQISDGQNRFGPGQSGASYCINNGQITDKNGRGCVITGPTDQFQCDQGASPTEGFFITSSGQVEFNGDDQFYACPSDDNGNYNIYTKPVENMPKCVKVSLSSADGTCAAPSSAPASSAPPATTAVSVSTATQAPSLSVSVSTEQCQASTIVKTVTQQNNVTVTLPPVTEQVIQKTTVEQPTTIEQPTTVQQLPVTETKSVQQPPITEFVTEQVTTSVAKPTTVEQLTTVSQVPVTETKVSSVQQPSATPSGTGNCPRDLPNMDSYLKPRLIIPVDSNNPDTAYGTQYNAYIGNGNSTIFDFDIPQSYKGKQCELVFTFPTQSQLETSFVSESGNGGVEFKQLKEAADEKTTFNTQPGVTKNFGEKGVSTGNAYSITTGDCAVGQTISYELTATGDKTIEFFQDYNPCPIGLWVIAN